VLDVATKLRSYGIPRLVVTGGEPLLQQRDLAVLLDSLDPETDVEVETNGTIPPSSSLVARVDQWNVSPKLSSAADPLHKRIRHAVLEMLRKTDRAWLKLVIASSTDIHEADSLMASLHWPADRVLFMPEACSRAALIERTPFVARAAAERGISVSPRLHIERFDGARGT
jgi:organic radical activating enzyme